MTVRELIELIDDTKNWFIELFSDAMSWWTEGCEKVFNGDFLDLTIGQALLVLFFSYLIFIWVIESIHNVIRFFKYPDDEDKPEE
jgi:hypothetical protein